ncbi:MAG: class I SAM-dependent methyltransferase, partial [Gammaproteobacteria bacterium]|nr:class I SAM-dependent methyltransferase [Gammaproteobacteria bacterium]
MNDIQLSISEKFISEFHNSNTGVTSKVFADLPVIKGTQLVMSSYQCLTSIVESQPGKLSILDLACGDGFLLSILAGRNQQDLSLLGIDLSQGEIDAARACLGNSAIISLSKAQDMPFADNSIDIVLCHMALMLMEDVELVLSELHRVLKKNSVFSAITGAKPPSSQE